MREEEIRKHLGKRVKLVLTDHTIFTGLVKEVSSDSLTILDKFDNIVSVNTNSIAFLMQINGGDGK